MDRPARARRERQRDRSDRRHLLRRHDRPSHMVGNRRRRFAPDHRRHSGPGLLAAGRERDPRQDATRSSPKPISSTDDTTASAPATATPFATPDRVRTRPSHGHPPSSPSGAGRRTVRRVLRGTIARVDSREERAQRSARRSAHRDPTQRLITRRSQVQILPPPPRGPGRS
jgi:hypothetical protein